MKRVLVPALLACLLAGCATWPEAGTGGYAERRPVADADLNALASRYEHLRQNGADRWAAGLSDETRVLFIRAQRNHAAGLLDDFAEDRWRIAHLLDAIELHLRNRKP